MPRRSRPATRLSLAALHIGRSPPGPPVLPLVVVEMQRDKQRACFKTSTYLHSKMAALVQQVPGPSRLWRRHATPPHALPTLGTSPLGLLALPLAEEGPEAVMHFVSTRRASSCQKAIA